jgi:probable addiction module antidote protein
LGVLVLQQMQDLTDDDTVNQTICAMMRRPVLAEETGLSRKGIQKALSEEGNPEFASINAIMHAMGYKLTPKKLEA